MLALSRIRFRGGRAAGACFTLTNMSPKETFGPATLTQQVAELQRRNIPGSARMEDAPCLAGQILRINPRESPRVSSEHPMRICGFYSSPWISQFPHLHVAILGELRSTVIRKLEPRSASSDVSPLCFAPKLCSVSDVATTPCAVPPPCPRNFLSCGMRPATDVSLCAIGSLLPPGSLSWCSMAV